MCWDVAAVGEAAATAAEVAEVAEVAGINKHTRMKGHHTCALDCLRKLLPQ